MLLEAERPDNNITGVRNRVLDYLDATALYVHGERGLRVYNKDGATIVVYEAVAIMETASDLLRLKIVPDESGKIAKELCGVVPDLRIVERVI